jgi:hypothetical protein
MTPGQASVLIYSTASIAAALLFFGVTVLVGDYTWVSRIGGAGWVFLLSMIILMPTVTPLVKRFQAKNGPAKE